MGFNGLRVRVVALGLLLVFSSASSPAAFSFRQQSPEPSRTGTFCKRMLVGGMLALGFGYFWFTDGSVSPPPPPLVLEEKPSAPPAPAWKEDARVWEALLEKGEEVSLDIFLEPGKPIELR